MKILKNGFSLCERFLYSSLYPFLITLIVTLCWAMEWEIPGMITLLWIACFILFFLKDTTPLLPLIFSVAMLFPKSVDPLSYGWQVFLFLIPLPIAIVYHVIKYRSKWKLGKQFYPQLCVSIVLLLGGVGVIALKDYMRGFTFALLLGFVILILYAILYQYTNPPKYVNLKRYLAVALIAAGAICVFEQAIHYFRNPELIFHAEISPSLGWAVANNTGTILLLTIPMCLYMAVTSEHPFVYLLGALLQTVTLIMTWSRGAVLVGAVTVPMALIYSCVKAQNKKRFFISCGVLLAAFLILFGTKFDEIIIMAKSMINQGMGSSGRFELYEEAWDCFIKSPVFGAGIGHNGPNFEIEVMPMYWFHSTFFQIIGSMGIVGLAAYVYSYVVRFSIILKRKRPFNNFILISMLGFEGYSMIDTGTFVPVPFMLMIVLITMVLEFINRAEDEKNAPLPAYLQV